MNAFEFDDYARRHLRKWYESGHAPHDWDEEILNGFTAWVEANAAELYENSSWPELANLYEKSLEGVSK